VIRGLQDRKKRQAQALGGIISHQEATEPPTSYLPPTASITTDKEELVEETTSSPTYDYEYQDYDYDYEETPEDLDALLDQLGFSAVGDPSEGGSVVGGRKTIESFGTGATWVSGSDDSPSDGVNTAAQTRYFDNSSSKRKCKKNFRIKFIRRLKIYRCVRKRKRVES